MVPVILLTALLTGCGHSSSGKQITIAVIPKGTTHEFWKSIHAGAVQASRELATEGAPVNII